MGIVLLLKLNNVTMPLKQVKQLCFEAFIDYRSKDGKIKPSIAEKLIKPFNTWWDSRIKDTSVDIVLPEAVLKPIWLSNDKLRIAVDKYKDNRLVAARYLRDIANAHVHNPLKWSSEFLNNFDQ